jgi:dTMP kinase
MSDQYKFHAPNCAANSFLVSFEGIEGSGKSTQVERFIELLKTNGFTVSYYREPGGTVFGEKLREAILESKAKIAPTAEAMLFASARAQLLTQNVFPDLLKENHVVILDRFIDSSIAYQGFARGLGMETVLGIHQHAPLNTLANLTFYLRIDYQTSIDRQSKRGQEKDYFEKEHKDFYLNLINGYDQAASYFDKRIQIIDAGKEINSVTDQIKKIWSKFLK